MRIAKTVSLLGCCLFCVFVQAQEIYSFQRFGYKQGSLEHNLNIVNTLNGKFFLLAGSIDFIGDNWRYLSYNIDEGLNSDFYSLIDGDSTSFNFGYYSSSFFDPLRHRVISGGLKFVSENAQILTQSILDANTYSLTELQLNDFSFFSQGKYLVDNHYAFVGYSRLDNSLGNIRLSILDSNENILLDKDYGTAENDIGYAFVQTLDGGFLLLGESRGYGPRIGLYNQALLIKTDSLGNELWRTTWGGYFNDCANNLAVTEDGGVIACGCISQESGSGNSNVAQGYVRKMDAEGVLIWDKTYEYKAPLQGGSPVVFNVVRVLENGNVFAVGSGYKINRDSSSFQTVPWAVIFDKNGNVLMERDYTSLVGGFSSAEFQDIQPTADGGFIAGGTYYPSQGDTGNQDAFIVKLDERGCEFPECQPPLAVEELSDGSFQLSVWPNPTSGLLHVEADSPIKEIRIFDQIGREAFSTPLELTSAERNRSEQIDVAELKRGLYFIAVQTAKGLETKKIIVGH